jgi:hypothetical protein
MSPAAQMERYEPVAEVSTWPRTAPDIDPGTDAPMEPHSLGVGDGGLADCGIGVAHLCHDKSAG